MRYEEFIKYILNGHEFIGQILSNEFKVLNVIDDYITIIIGNEHKHYLYDNIEKEIIYDNKTFKELYNNIKLEEMF